MKKRMLILLFISSMAFVKAQAQQAPEAFINDVAIHASVNFLSIAGTKTGSGANGADTYYQSKLKPTTGTAQVIVSKDRQGYFIWTIPMSQAKQIQADVILLMKNIVKQDTLNYFVEEDTDEKGNKATILYEDGEFDESPVLSVLCDIDKNNAANSRCIITVYGRGPFGDSYLTTHSYIKNLDEIDKLSSNSFKDIIGQKIKTGQSLTFYDSKYQSLIGDITIAEENTSASRYLTWRTPLALSQKLQTDAETYIKNKYANNPLYKIETTEDTAKGLKITSVTVLSFPVFETGILKNGKDLSPDENQFIIMIYETSEKK